MRGVGRYFRLFWAFARFGLAAEMSYRANFLIKLLVEALWLGILLIFFNELYNHTSLIAGWDRYQYLFFMGCHYALAGVIETFFLENCIGFADLVRSGDLDHYLLKPIDEQFLITGRGLDWSTAPNILQGVIIMVVALVWSGWPFDPLRLLAFAVLFVCGAAMAYSFLLILASTSVWFVRNQSLMELWWLFSTLMRHPRQIFNNVWWAEPLGRFFTLIVPILLVVSVPAETMVKVFEPGPMIGVLVAAVVLLWLSRRMFLLALRSYRSASS
jgi:ABC-2 type transport system permease protein